MDRNGGLLDSFETSSQCMNWIFKKDELQEIRERSLQCGIERVMDAMRREQELVGKRAAVEPEFLTLKEQLTYCRAYERKLLDFCKYFRLSKVIQATALAFIRRLYIRNTVMELDPKIYILACASLGCKVENIHISFDEFISKMPKAPSHKVLFDSELHLSAQLRYEFMVHLPYWPLHGFYLDLQTYVRERGQQDTKESDSRNKNEDVQFLLKLYNRAQEFVIPGILSDVLFTHPPSRIALACMLLASIECDWRPQFIGYIEDRFSKASVSHQAIIDDIEFIKTEIKAVTEEEYDKISIAKIDSKLKTCINPEFDESSAL